MICQFPLRSISLLTTKSIFNASKLIVSASILCDAAVKRYLVYTRSLTYNDLLNFRVL